ncbi:MAG TPA: ATP-binding protein [Patescibacteria group bacterium]|nr:ATP-binding protein [Patescibacteria group bacterium]
MSGLRMRPGAVVLAVITAVALCFAWVNFRQRASFVSPDDGVTWSEDPAGLSARWVAQSSPAARAGILPGDILTAIDGAHVSSPLQVTRRLWRIGTWNQTQYTLTRGGRQFQATLVLEPATHSESLENYLRIVGLLYLFIGLFILARRSTAPRAVHFYLFCLVSFVLYSFHYTGKLNQFDQEIYWCNVVATLLQPALLVHFALLFPERHRNVKPALLAVYGIPAVSLALRLALATHTAGFVPSLDARLTLDRLDLLILGTYFVLAAGLFLVSFLRAPSGILRQQLKWVAGGTAAGVLPFLLIYILPYFAGAVPGTWMKLSVVSLGLLPLCFAYAIIRYRLMDVDIIFKRGLAYTVATLGVVVVYFGAIAVVGELSHLFVPDSSMVNVLAVLLAAFLFQPMRDWVQTRLDRFFYRDRLDYRRTLIEFGSTLTREVRLEPMLESVLDRISQTFLVDRLALFLRDPGPSGRLALARSMGIVPEAAADLSFLEGDAFPPTRNYLFFETGRAAQIEDEHVRASLERLDLNYFLPCRVRDEVVAVLAVGKTVDGDFLTSDDVELLESIAGYVGIAVQNSRLYQSLELKAEQVERLKDFSENIVGSLNVGVMALDLAGRVDSWNPQLEKLTGIPRQEAFGRNVEALLPGELVAELETRAGNGHGGEIYKFPLVNRTGQGLIVNVSVTPLEDKNGSQLGRLVLMDDITERMQLEQQLLQTEKLTSLGLLAAGVAHEVNTPLAVISNYIQMLARQLPGDDSRQKIIEKIVKQTFRASEIVNNLLNFSRTGAAEFSAVNLNEVIEETLTLVSHPFRAARVSVIKNFEEHLPAVDGSSNRLQQVFLNLFLNARDAMPSGGMLEVRTLSRNGSVEVEVTDTGIGIPGENLRRIFDPFFTTKATGRGTGLGLSVSYGIVQEHKGRIDVRSTPGKGTSFRLEFPANGKSVHV